MYLGIDLGTSSVKAVVVDDEGLVQDEASVPLHVQRPGVGMSEQSPNDWWVAVEDAVSQLEGWSRGVRAIGLSGQMHGAVLTNKDGKPLRNAILWNDVRADKECAELEERVDVRGITGNAAMAGFTAPKLAWVRSNEPENFAATAKVLLPKDFVRFCMTGAFASEMSDASGTLWLDVNNRCWSEEMLEATGMTLSHMPELFEGSDVTAVLSAEVARRWNMNRVPVVGGAGDQAAGAVGAGAVDEGKALVSIGTSGVIFVPDREHSPNPSRGVHAFCHALPDRWHRMAVILSAASALTWVAQITRAESEAALIDEIEASEVKAGRIYFLPYLSGERTPHNDVSATGTFVGLSHATDRAELGYAVLEGVAFALRDCQQALAEVGASPESMDVIGGGAQSMYWGKLIADALATPLTYRRDAQFGPALGAARQAILGNTGRAVSSVCSPPPFDYTIQPDPAKVDLMTERYETFRALYRDLKERFASLR